MKPCSNNIYWVCKDGTQIKYKDMSDSHLINVIDFMNKRITNFINKCISQNEEVDIPDWVEEVMSALIEERERRYKCIK